jgi:hypothetical protein
MGLNDEHRPRRTRGQPGQQRSLPRNISLNVQEEAHP